MSYHKKTRFGQYVQVAGMGADDPWASGGEGTVSPTASNTGFFESLFGAGASVGSGVASAGGSVASGTQTLAAGGGTNAGGGSSPSTISQVGAGIGAFLKGIGTPPAPRPGYPQFPPGMYPKPGMSSTTKLALAGGGALLLVLLLTRD